MHTKEEVGLFLLAREDGMSVAEAAAFVGVGGGAARSWDAGMLPHSYTGGPARRDDSRPDREAAAQGGVGRPKRGRLAPPSTPMRSRCGLAGRLRGPPVFRRRRLPASLTSPGAPTTTTSRGHLAGGRPTRPPCAGLRGVGLSKKMSASPSAMNALHVRSVPLPRGPNDASAPLSATLPIRLARATWARVCVAHADLASVRRVKHLATRQALHVLSS